MAALPESVLYEGVFVDFSFADPRPGLGDLDLICGSNRPRFPPCRPSEFARLSELQFDQADDFFGVRSLSGDGDDVVVWLYPLVGGKPAHHHPGPFDGLRLSYCVLRNPARHAGHFLRCVRAFGALSSGVTYRGRGVDLGMPPNLSTVSDDIDAIVEHWAGEGIVVGSDAALEVDY